MSCGDGDVLWAWVAGVGTCSGCGLRGWEHVLGVGCGDGDVLWHPHSCPSSSTLICFTYCILLIFNR